jgi:hypothetical protein
MKQLRLLAGVVLALVLIGGMSFSTADEKKKEPDKKEPEKKFGSVMGTLTAKGDTWIEVKADGEEKARRYSLVSTAKERVGLDPNRLFDFMAGGKDHLDMNDIARLASRDPAAPERWKKFMKEQGIAGDRISREQFALYMQTRLVEREFPGVKEMKVGERVQVSWVSVESVRATKVEAIKAPEEKKDK